MPQEENPEMNNLEKTNGIPDYILKMVKPTDLKNVMDNAKSKGRMDVYWIAFERLCEIQGQAYPDKLESDFYSMLSAYEALLHEKHGRNVAASRTRQKLGRLGFKKCLEDWALAKTATQGFDILTKNGMSYLTAEAIVLKHSNSFEDVIVDAAKRRLESSGIDASCFLENKTKPDARLRGHDGDGSTSDALA